MVGKGVWRDGLGGLGEGWGVFLFRKKNQNLSTQPSKCSRGKKRQKKKKSTKRSVLGAGTRCFNGRIRGGKRRGMAGDLVVSRVKWMSSIHQREKKVGNGGGGDREKKKRVQGSVVRRSQDA